MGGENDRQLLSVLLLDMIQQSLKKGRLPFFPVKSSVLGWKVMRIDVRHGPDITDDISGRVGHFQDMLFPVRTAVCLACNVSDDGDIEMLPQTAVNLQFGATVVIAGSNDNLCGGACLMDGQQPFGIHFLGGRRGSRGMIDIPADE